MEEEVKIIRKEDGLYRQTLTVSAEEKIGNVEKAEDIITGILSEYVESESALSSVVSDISAALVSANLLDISE